MLTFHHVGCLTEDMEQSIVAYRDVMGFKNISQVFNITEQQVRVCFVETGPGAYLELVELSGENPSLSKILKSRNPYYHVGYQVDDMDSSLQELESKGCRQINRFRSEAFGNKWCAFLFNTDMHLIELIER
jgi:methylmalonyl-CoA/ethylmalonyl-CoA epimerase